VLALVATSHRACFSESTGVRGLFPEGNVLR
jgi:hypothetical protein